MNAESAVYQRQALHLRLRNQHAVERITMMRRQHANCEHVSLRDGKVPDAADSHKADPNLVLDERITQPFGVIA